MSGIGTPLRVATISVHACPLAPPGAWETGGMNIYIREVSRYLSELGVQVDIFTRRQGPDDHGTDDATVVPFAEHARVIHIDAGPPRYLPKEDVVGYLPEFICNMRDFIRNEELSYDVVHSHYWLSGRVSGYFKNVWQVPMVAMFHTLAELKNQVSLGPDETESDVRVGIERMTVATADRVVASTITDSDHLEQYYDADTGRITIVPCGVDVRTFHAGSATAARRALGWSDEAVILFVGRIQQLKGIDVLLHAAALLAPRVLAGILPPFRVVIVGGRPTGGDDPQAREIERLHALAQDLGVAEFVRWVGAVEHEALPQYYQAADVTVMPSTYESFGLVAVESMACGTPVVAARVGGLQTTVQDGETGYLIHAREPALYAARIAEILTQPDLRARLGVAARERAATFGWQHVARQLVGLYEDLIREQSTGAPPATVLQQ
ncbi:MAG: D-inositol-3-phosphate glycosyltransferase [Chloroflexota bacterium]|nr:D-inositol-3-phosphate glycosyltransferase [Chloroflexota bacterium]